MDKRFLENKKIGVDAFNELAESHEAHVRQVEKLENKLKQLIDDRDNNMLKLIGYIQATQSEMDLQIKTSKEILEEYNENS